MFFQESYQNVSNSMYPNQTQYLIEPDLGLNCLQRLLADNTSRHKSYGKGTVIVFTFELYLLYYSIPFNCYTAQKFGLNP